MTFLPGPLSGELLDPFSSLPESRVTGINVLLKHCLCPLHFSFLRFFPHPPPFQPVVFVACERDDDLLTADIHKPDLSSAVYKTFPWQPACSTNPTTTYVVPLVLQDTVLFHAVLAFSALRLRREKARSLGVNLRVLDSECIRLLRERVESGDAIGISDQTISAVATLAAVEVCCFRDRIER